MAQVDCRIVILLVVVYWLGDVPSMGSMDSTNNRETRARRAPPPPISMLVHMWVLVLRCLAAGSPGNFNIEMGEGGRVELNIELGAGGGEDGVH